MVVYLAVWMAAKTVEHLVESTVVRMVLWKVFEMAAYLAVWMAEQKVQCLAVLTALKMAVYLAVWMVAKKAMWKELKMAGH